MKDIVTVAVVNWLPKWGDIPHNLNRIIGYIETAGKQGADMIAFPEVALNSAIDEIAIPGMEIPAHEQRMIRRTAEPIPGPSTRKIAEVTKKYNMYALVGMSERPPDEPDKVYNAIAVIGPEGVVAVNRKMHLPSVDAQWADYPSSDISKNDILFDTPWGRMAMANCYDTYEFPEISRYARAKGARLIFNCTCLPLDVGIEKSNVALQYLAGTCSMYVATSNYFGMDPIDPGLKFLGGSSILGPCAAGTTDIEYYAGGPFTLEGSNNRGRMFMATIDLSLIQNNHLAEIFTYNVRLGRPDWRPDLYRNLLDDVINDPDWQAQFREDETERRPTFLP